MDMKNTEATKGTEMTEQERTAKQATNREQRAYLMDAICFASPERAERIKEQLRWLEIEAKSLTVGR